MGEILVGDIETNGTSPNEIFMVGVLNYDTDEFTAYVGDDVPYGMLRLAEADAFIGHYIKGFDVPVMERLSSGLVTFRQEKLIDTLEMSKKLCNLKRHGLAAWGDLFEYPKFPQPTFDEFTPEMVPYCERDCRLNKKVAEFLFELEEEVYRRQRLLEAIAA